MAAMTTTAHNYDDVKALLMPKNFDEGNAKVLPRRIISRRSSAPLHLSATQAAPPPSPYLWSSPTEEERRRTRSRRRRRTRSTSEEDEESSSRRRRARAEECRRAPRGGTEVTVSQGGEVVTWRRREGSPGAPAA